MIAFVQIYDISKPLVRFISFSGVPILNSRRHPLKTVTTSIRFTISILKIFQNAQIFSKALHTMIFRIFNHFRVFPLEMVEIKLMPKADIDMESSIQDDNKMYVKSHDDFR